MELVIVRHSTTGGNLEKRFVGRTDIPLIPEGEALARELSSEMPKVERVYTSPLLRCRQTAALLWPEAESIVVDDLIETDFGPFEGKNHEELKDDPRYQQWLKDGDFKDGEEGEPIHKVAERMQRAILSVVEDARAHGQERVAVMAHGGVLMTLMTACGAPARKSFYDWGCKNASGWLVRFDEGDPFTLTVLKPVGRNEK